MEYNSIYRRFRPKTFDDVIGQDHIVRTLTNQIKAGKIRHAYLFTGTRGTGKTSCAKIFSRAVNCLTPVNGSPCGKCEVCRKLQEDNGVDIIEIDAASNNSVDEIRTLKENVMYRPTIGRYKVYIVDEVHMLSASAFNALLKTLEEPPEHVVFILATTEVQKIPQTILSRCVRFDFRLIDVDVLVDLLKKIFNELNVKYDERALVKIAVQGEGSVRDTLSAADSCMSYCGNNVTYEDVLEILGATDFDSVDRLCKAILDGDTGSALSEADKMLRKGRTTLGRDLANYLNDLITVKNVPGYRKQSMTSGEHAILVERASGYSDYRIARVMEMMADVENRLRFASQPRILLEAIIVKACLIGMEKGTDGIEGRLSDVESKIENIERFGAKIPTHPPVEEEAEEEREEKVEPKKEKKGGIENLLAGISEETTKEKLVFKDEPEFEFVNEAAQDVSREGEAAEIWSRMQADLAKSNELTLNIICEGINGGMTIEGTEFVLYTSDKATYEMLNKKAKLMTDFIKAQSDGKYTFVCRLRQEDTIDEETHVKLADLFNGTVKFKQ